MKGCVYCELCILRKHASKLSCYPEQGWDIQSTPEKRDTCMYNLNTDFDEENVDFDVPHFSYSAMRRIQLSSHVTNLCIPGRGIFWSNQKHCSSLALSPIGWPF